MFQQTSGMLCLKQCNSVQGNIIYGTNAQILDHLIIMITYIIINLKLLPSL